MAACAPFPIPNYGCIGVHAISFHKDLLGWIDNSKKFVLGAGNTATVSIDRLSDPAPGADYLMAQVPIGESANLYYTVEVRKFFDYDTQVPHSGVLIHEVDLNRGSRTAQVIDVDEGGNPNGPGAILTAGQSFTDDANEITVTVDQETATGAVVTVTLGGAVGPGNDPPPDYPEYGPRAVGVSRGHAVTLQRRRLVLRARRTRLGCRPLGGD